MTSQPRYRIYADANDRNADGDYFLIFEDSKRQLVAMGVALGEGARVILNVQDEYEVEAVLTRSEADECWMGRADYKTIRYLDGTQT